MAKKINILAVDDDDNILEIIKTALSSNANYNITTAVDGAEALDLLEDKDFDLVLLDIMMPNVSGIEVCKAMVANKKLSKIPVMLISALPVGSMEFKKSKINFDELKVIKDVIEKPFAIDDLLNRVNAVIKKSK